jgi:two-component system sensor histidine kinase CpxA
MKTPLSSLYTKVMGWLLVNLTLVVMVVALFLLFQTRGDLGPLLGRQTNDRIRSAVKLLAYDLAAAPRSEWDELLNRHARSHNIDFTLLFRNGRTYSSLEPPPPAEVSERVESMWRNIARNRMERRSALPDGHRSRDGFAGEVMRQSPPPDPRQVEAGRKARFSLHTRNPDRYWKGIPFFVPRMGKRVAFAALLISSDSFTGNGFFFDPLPWVLTGVLVFGLSVLLWIPLVRHITRPLARMTRAAETIARGRLEVRIEEPRRDEIGRLAGAINHMTGRLSGYVKGQKRFLGDIAHELGSPIARIQFGLGALEQRVGPDNRERVADVAEDVAHLSGLVNELLSFSRAEMASGRVAVKRVDPAAVIQRVLEREAPDPAAIVIDGDPSLRIAADPDLLARALANLVRNALRYAGNAGTITVRAAAAGGDGLIEVRDEGPGVPGHLLDQLFEPFFRPEPSRDRDSGGVGLGLAIVKTCIETCGGSVTARNCTPRGFAVTIRLPLSR